MTTSRMGLAATRIAQAAFSRGNDQKVIQGPKNAAACPGRAICKRRPGRGLGGEPLARKAVLRKAADLEGKREGLQSSLDHLLDKSSDDTDQLAKIVRGKLLEAKKRWEAVASPAQLNQLSGELVGPSLVSSDGRLLSVEKEKPAHVNDDVHGAIAGGGFEPPTSGL